MILNMEYFTKAFLLSTSTNKKIENTYIFRFLFRYFGGCLVVEGPYQIMREENKNDEFIINLVSFHFVSL